MKKMRKLIPAFAMLMVAAIMMTTASFAWFTMNSQVTATGMQIQAQADTSLLISASPLTATGDTAGAPKLQFANTTVNKLTPMTYNSGSTTLKGAQIADANKTTGFITATTPADVNIETGIYEGGYTSVTSATGFYVSEEFYVASAGDSFTGSLTFQLRAPSITAGSGVAGNAYAAAIYVITDPTNALWADDATITTALEATTKPSAIIFVDSTSNRNTFTIEDVKVPTVVGAGEQDNPAVGIKVIVRFYVDGELKNLNDTVQVDTGYIYTNATSYAAGGNYFKPVFGAVDRSEIEALAGTTEPKVPFGWYTKDATTGVYTNATGAELDAEKDYFVVTGAEAITLTGDQQVVGATLPAGSYTRVMTKTAHEYTFVRTSAVPSGSTELELLVTSAKNN